MWIIKNLLAPKYLLAIAVFYTLLILYGSLAGTGGLPKITYKVSDKSIHFLGYFFWFVFWFLYAFFKTKKNNFSDILLKIIGLGLLFGIIIEVLQGSLTVSRQSDFYDVVANFLGLTTAAVIAWLFKSRLITLKNAVSF